MVLPSVICIKAVGCMQVSINTECSFVRDVLRGSDVSELRLKLLSLNKEEYPFKDDD